MYVLLYIDVNNMLVSWCFFCERQTCVPPSRPTIVDVKSRINKMAHNNYSFFLSFVLNECPLPDPKMHKFILFSVSLLLDFLSYKMKGSILFRKTDCKKQTKNVFVAQTLRRIPGQRTTMGVFNDFLILSPKERQEAN